MSISGFKIFHFLDKKTWYVHVTRFSQNVGYKRRCMHAQKHSESIVKA